MFPAFCYTCATTHRYGFNGKEKDNEIKGSGNSLDFEARFYDSRLGRWLSIDPRYYEMPEWAPYSFAFNNPLMFIDPDGEKPKPITTKQFRQYANLYGYYNNNRIGDFFERLAIASVRTTRPEVIHNTFMNFDSPVRSKMNLGLPGAVRPDGMTLTLGGHSLPIRGFTSTAFYEAKVSKATITKKYRKGQITGMIDVLGNQRDDKGEFMVLTLITTSDTKISDEIKEYAAYRCVYLKQSVAAIDDETGEFILSDPEWINKYNPIFGVGGSIDQVIETFDFDNYNTFEPIIPSSELEPGNSIGTDPDPPTIED